LLVKFYQLVDLEQWKRFRHKTDLLIIILGKIETDYSDKIVIILYWYLQQLFKGKMKLYSFNYETEGVPLDVYFILFGVV
jgi:hypothetical protein